MNKALKEETYDFVIVGGGPNGVGTAAYLAKSGENVIVLEERPECGGGAENTEVVPGVLIDPHTTYFYAGGAPGLEQLELWKYGFRLNIRPGYLGKLLSSGMHTTEGMSPVSLRDVEGLFKITGMTGTPPFVFELVRSIYYTPPHPPEVEVTVENTPFMQVYKKHAPDVWTPELLKMTLFDLMDEYFDTEPWKVEVGSVAWYDGAAPHHEGVAVPSLGAALLLFLTQVNTPIGGMHDYFHAIFRCAIAHHATIRTTCPVEEIIIRNGRAVGVRLRDNATCSEKTIWANKAVISNVDIQQTFLKLIGPQHTDQALRQGIKDISLKGGSLYVSHFLLNEPPRYRPKFKLKVPEDIDRVMPCFYPCDSREIFYEHVADVDGRKGFPTMPPERALWCNVGAKNRVPQTCRPPNRWLISPLYYSFPAPEYQLEGPDASAREKAKWDAWMRQIYGQVFENIESALVAQWSNTPWESEHRNAGLVGGNWTGAGLPREQWAEKRPIDLLPELSRYRTPIDGLYLAHQTSAHPGGLALLAIPYNLMHILIEDGLVEPGDWWYSAPQYIPQTGKVSAAKERVKV